HFTEVVPAFYSSCPSQASRFRILAFEVHGYGAEEYFCSLLEGGEHAQYVEVNCPLGGFLDKQPCPRIAASLEQ
ncbi:MAG: hypothetical protein ACQXXK_06570, partial [Methanothrix sp.]|uniref:hypothetical protein n=1 Tax=Methanothrix sp. TaxID=90426 RepID=UPI003D2A3242